jgi:hypothetical protein
VVNVGHDPDMSNAPVFAFNIAPVVAGLYVPGADEQAHATISLLINGTPAANGGVDSGLTTTDGQKIYLFNENGIIVGRIDGDHDGQISTGDANDVAAFAVTINQLGQVSVAQYLSIHNADPTNPNDTETLGQVLSAQLKVTDNDGDTVTQSVVIGTDIHFNDDGPKLTVTAPAAVNGLDFGNFVLNNNEWGQGSGTATGTNGGWTMPTPTAAIPGRIWSATPAAARFSSSVSATAISACIRRAAASWSTSMRLRMTSRSAK